MTSNLQDPSSPFLAQQPEEMSDFGVEALSDTHSEYSTSSVSDSEQSDGAESTPFQSLVGSLRMPSSQPVPAPAAEPAAEPAVPAAEPATVPEPAEAKAPTTEKTSAPPAPPTAKAPETVQSGPVDYKNALPNPDPLPLCYIPRSEVKSVSFNIEYPERRVPTDNTDIFLLGGDVATASKAFSRLASFYTYHKAMRLFWVGSKPEDLHVHLWNGIKMLTFTGDLSQKKVYLHYYAPGEKDPEYLRRIAGLDNAASVIPVSEGFLDAESFASHKVRYTAKCSLITAHFDYRKDLKCPCPLEHIHRIDLPRFGTRRSYRLSELYRLNDFENPDADFYQTIAIIMTLIAVMFFIATLFMGTKVDNYERTAGAQSLVTTTTPAAAPSSHSTIHTVLLELGTLTVTTTVARVKQVCNTPAGKEIPLSAALSAVAAHSPGFDMAYSGVLALSEYVVTGSIHAFEFMVDVLSLLAVSFKEAAKHTRRAIDSGMIYAVNHSAWSGNRLGKQFRELHKYTKQGWKDMSSRFHESFQKGKAAGHKASGKKGKEDRSFFHKGW